MKWVHLYNKLITISVTFQFFSTTLKTKQQIVVKSWQKRELLKNVS